MLYSTPATPSAMTASYATTFTYWMPGPNVIKLFMAEIYKCL
jgi:hypothetical protein